ncbi:MAG: M48 family metallopeptidase [Candidatus Pacebacteria bacterium]|nr:M48 family metallopeptidase [Candidatus Paceibacterota bacterium]
MNFILNRNSRSNKISLKIDRNGQVIVTAPRLVPEFLIKKFVQQQTDWITNNQKKIANKLSFLGQDFIDVFGKKYQLKITSSLGPSKVILQKDELIIELHNLKPDFKFEPNNPPAVLTRFLKNTAQHYITERASILSKKMNLSYRKISFKTQKTRWGSCSSTKNLNFNLRLVHFKPAIIDYVIIHELAHLEQMNHSKKFWDLVEKYQPEYRIHRGWLKRHGSTID